MTEDLTQDLTEDLMRLSPQIICQQCTSLLIYRSLFHDPIAQAFLALLTALSRETDSAPIVDAYGTWFSALAEQQQGWQAYLLERILTVENPFTQSLRTTTLADLPAPLITAVKRDLKVLQRIYACSSEQICAWLNDRCPNPEPFPAWANHLPWGSETDPLTASDQRPIAQKTLQTQLENSSDWSGQLAELAQFYRQFGTGLFAISLAFRWQKGQWQPIAHPDTFAAATLVGYETQREQLLKNTEFLLAGLPALHVLLYGSRGSGKSSLVKSLVQEYGDRALRLIEVAKAELSDLPTIVEQLRDLPQKFVIFVDDLSFEADEQTYKALKVVLEGNLTACPRNVVIYATSNRRHLIREFFDDRPRPRDADEVHQWDTVQEKLSLSDRFGLTLTFEPADQDTYLKIVHHLAQQESITIAPADLEFQALQWATRHNGRSGRTARQFIDFLRADLS